jgi:hypothetical protein
MGDVKIRGLAEWFKRESMRPQIQTPVPQINKQKSKKERKKGKRQEL